jgi:hypothetical protein
MRRSDRHKVEEPVKTVSKEATVSLDRESACISKSKALKVRLDGFTSVTELPLNYVVQGRFGGGGQNGVQIKPRMSSGYVQIDSPGVAWSPGGSCS